MIIDGTAVATEMLSEMKHYIAMSAHRKPGLAFVLVGDDPASQTYVKMKRKRCEEVGMTSYVVRLEVDVTLDQLREEVDKLNNDEMIDGILVQQPLPEQLPVSDVLSMIDPDKDVDGFHPVNMGKLMIGDESGFIPCTPKGILKLLSASHIDLNGKHVVVIGRSLIVGKPLALLLGQKKEGLNATVTMAHSGTQNLKELCLTADLIVVAAGRPDLLTADMVKQGAVIIDVGVNRLPNGELCGDVDFEPVSKISSHITPVPGGVGPMTIAMLLSNTLKSCRKRCS
ncbi:MAG: bifunctional methylenetetrahydrofolate dehydrogenase/methenyltetrahydrofolate cyclohydrolase FolD [Simkaniaceae bacterium]|nr:bifunctional methylenetetrahydrofolate dehydrogenase/methenyltetrahydrofolate cyclohydrolase FolD [Simkaniaceae bacterium]